MVTRILRMERIKKDYVIFTTENTESTEGKERVKERVKERYLLMDSPVRE